MSNRHPKIALVVSHLKGGGKEQCVVNLANSLRTDGFQPMIVCLETAGALRKRVQHPDVDVIELYKRAGNNLGLPYRLARVFKTHGVHIVHTNNWGTLVESVLAARLAGIRSIVHTQHGLDYEWNVAPSQWREHMRTVVKRIASRWVMRIVAVSEEIRNMIIREWRAPEGKVSIIHNGIDVNGRVLDPGERADRRQQLGFGKSDVVIGSVGLFRPVKDFPILIAAMAQVVSHAPRARLLLVGDGQLRKDFEELVGQLGLGAHVNFLGHRADVNELLPLMDLFALCSRSEGISLSILEAMAASLPIVATRVGGNPEIVRDRQTGILVSPHSPDETAKAILSLIDDPAGRQTMGRQGRETVLAHFSIERMAKDYERLYADIHD